MHAHAGSFSATVTTSSPPPSFERKVVAVGASRWREREGEEDGLIKKSILIFSTHSMTRSPLNADVMGSVTVPTANFVRQGRPDL